MDFCCVGTRAGFFGGLGLAARGEDARQENGDEERGGSQRQPLTARKLAEPVRCAVAFREHGPAAVVASDVVGELADRRVAPRGLFAKSGEDDGIELAVEMAGRRVVLDDGAHDFVRELAFFAERVFVRENFVEQDAEGEDVGGGGDWLFANLLRAGVFGREQCQRFRIGGRIGIEELSDAEVEQLDGSGFSNEDVAGLEVAMNGEMAMRVFHRVADLEEEVEALTDAEVVGPAIRRDRNAVDEFHDEVRITAGGGAGIQDRRDVGVIELGENAALVLKAAEEEIVDVVVAEDLDGDAFFEAAVGSGGFKNDAHAASAEFLLETVSAELRSGGDGRAEDGGRRRGDRSSRCERRRPRACGEARPRVWGWIERDRPGERCGARTVLREGPQTLCGVG